MGSSHHSIQYSWDSSSESSSWARADGLSFEACTVLASRLPLAFAAFVNSPPIRLPYRMCCKEQSFMSLIPNMRLILFNYSWAIYFGEVQEHVWVHSEGLSELCHSDDNRSHMSGILSTNKSFVHHFLWTVTRDICEINTAFWQIRVMEQKILQQMLPPIS